MKDNKKNNEDLRTKFMKAYMERNHILLEKRINQYISVKLVNGRTFIYVNNRIFIQCIRLILNISKKEAHLYDEVDSIDEAAKMYEKHVYQNRIVRGPMAVPLRNQKHDITPEQEFWGHCSNIQAWVEHNYDTRILMSNISFPLLRELTKVGDPIAKKVYKEEIALRLESGYPSVVQYLLTQGYLHVFTPDEFNTILESTDLIKNLSSNSRILSQFIRSSVSKFPTLLEDILFQILKLPDYKKIILSSLKKPAHISIVRPYLKYNDPLFLYTLHTALENVFLQVDEKTGEFIIDCIQIIKNELRELIDSLPDVTIPGYSEAYKDFTFNNIPFDEFTEVQKLIYKYKMLEQIRRSHKSCSYCGKIIQRRQETCLWCGHRRDDDFGGSYPYPYIFRPPGPPSGGILKRMVLNFNV